VIRHERSGPRQTYSALMHPHSGRDPHAWWDGNGVLRLVPFPVEGID
jgi:hypothetical protein